MVKIPHEPLQAAWQRFKYERPDKSQKELALEWGLSDGAISQYINGHTALNTEAALWFARYMECAITDIWPDFEFRDLVPGKLPPAAVAIARAWAQCDPEQQAAFAALITAASKSKKS